MGNISAIQSLLSGAEPKKSGFVLRKQVPTTAAISSAAAKVQSPSSYVASEPAAKVSLKKVTSSTSEASSSQGAGISRTSNPGGPTSAVDDMGLRQFRSSPGGGAGYAAGEETRKAIGNGETRSDVLSKSRDAIKAEATLGDIEKVATSAQKVISESNKVIPDVKELVSAAKDATTSSLSDVAQQSGGKISQLKPGGSVSIKVA